MRNGASLESAWRHVNDGLAPFVTKALCNQVDSRKEIGKRG